MLERLIITTRGSVTIPPALRQIFGLNPGAELVAEQTAEGILLRPSISVPLEIYTEERIAEFASDEEELSKLYPPPENA